MIAKTLAFAFSFLLPLLLVRRLAQNEFGLYKQVFLFVDTAVSFLSFGFSMSAMYFLPREPTRKGQIVFNILLFHAFVGVLLCLALFLNPSLLARALNGPELVEHAPLIGVLILLWLVSSFLEIIAIAQNELRLATAFIVGTRFLRSVFLLAAAITLPSVRMLIYASIAYGLLQTLILLIYLRSRFGAFWEHFEWALMRTQMSYALPHGVAAMLYIAFVSLDNYFVSYQFGSAAYAIYAVGCFNIPLVIVIGEAVGQVMVPRVSLLQKQGNTREIIELTTRMMRKLSAIYFPLYVFLLIAGRDLIIVLFTRQYLASWPIFAINVTLIPLGIIAVACDPTIRAYAEHRYFLLKARSVLLVIFVVAVWYGMKRFGMIGAISMAVSLNLIERLVVAWKVWRVLGITRDDVALLKDTGKIALAACCAGLLTAVARTLVLDAAPVVILAFCALVFSISYLFLIPLFGILTPDERNTFRRIVARLPRQIFSRLSSSSAGTYGS
jgi:O-antigen/teichoic acid export membrane protein